MHIYSKFILITSLLFSGCTKPAHDEESRVSPKVSVQVAEVTTGTIDDPLTLSASTLYLKRNIVTAPIAAYITKVFVRLGDAVKAGRVLYQLETKERRALGSRGISGDSLATSFGTFAVKAPTSGMVSTLDKQAIGDYVMEGAQLCTLAESRTLAFAVNVPFEFSAYTKAGMACMLVLPDNSRHAGAFTTPLSTMNGASQTQTILAKADDPLFLPENLNVRVIVNKHTQKAQQLLPKACVLSDEMLEKFWVMQLVNDTTAVRVDVRLGNTNRESAEILSPTFQPGAKFLISGNYGLPDTASVKVIR